ncbi:hypothetical protein E8E13_000394 [Curvularia kusanoi]|uniref:Major facilitator superfamily (MFS) profile domain-containing protein n=1 Tax=Curvularia kusanoi TaxID=90978 RepID=A0A9P4T3N7_CURKU|nr:hypothetical protein E8E13_000394 [Curvularia kusanoi]
MSVSTNPPDGGAKAWLAVAGAWCGLFVSFGWITCMGLFQAHYQNHQLSAYSPSSIAWIPSVETFFLFVSAPFSGKAFDDYGPRPLLILGTFLHVFGLMMLSLCQQYYQFFLAQSVCSALGAGAIFWASNNSVGTWFNKRRGLALGIVSSGSSVGGVVGSASIPALISRVGFGWAMRITAFLYLALLLVALAMLRSRLEHTPSRSRLIELLNPLREWYISSLGIAGFLVFLGVFLPYNYLVVEAVAAGMDRTLADSLLVVMSATSILGRIVPGWAGDRLGRFNVTITLTFLSSLFVLAVWGPASNDSIRVAFSALYGFTSGAFVSMVPTLIAQVCPDPKKLGTYMGAVYLIISPSVIISQPLGGALSSIGRGNMIWMKVFCALILAIGGLMVVVARSVYITEVHNRNRRGVAEVTDLANLRGLRKA